MGATADPILRLLGSLAMLLLCAGPAAGEEVREVRHRNGLALVLPVDMAVTGTADGFVVDPGPFRSMGPVTVRLQALAAAGDDGWPDRRAIGDRVLSYRIDYLGEGGSGGAEYAITARETSALGDVVYTQQAQSELGAPTFELFWRIVEQVRPSAGN